jgi:hypothetical protein
MTATLIGATVEAGELRFDDTLEKMLSRTGRHCVATNCAGKEAAGACAQVCPLLTEHVKGQKNARRAGPDKR